MANENTIVGSKSYEKLKTFNAKAFYWGITILFMRKYNVLLNSYYYSGEMLLYTIKFSLGIWELKYIWNNNIANCAIGLWNLKGETLTRSRDEYLGPKRMSMNTGKGSKTRTSYFLRPINIVRVINMGKACNQNGVR